MEKKLNVLLIGGGGREHAIAWKIAQSVHLNHLFIAPGNAGTASLGTNLAIRDTDFPALKEAVTDHNIDLIVVGPEAPLVKGIREYFECDSATEHVKIVGPGRQGAMLEGSKSFSKQFMKKYEIPTAKYGRFTSAEMEDALKFLDKMNAPFVLKADGLAGGKGVLILDDLEEAKKATKLMLQGEKFGSAGEVVVIEEFLKGIELSCFVLTDGEHFISLPNAKDYKRIGEGDTGLNTGGMGSISPVPFADAGFMKKVQDRIIQPTIDGLKSSNIPYNGFIFFGLMSVDGNPFVIEYNCRMGDPETESIMPRINSDLLELLWKCGSETLRDAEINISDQSCASVMLVSGGYPESYEKGKIIEGLDAVSTIVFHAGTAVDDSRVVTSGGRVMTLTAIGDDHQSALAKCYEQCANIRFEGMYFRSDLGFDLIGKN